jgi:hypothetical protein
MGEKLAIAERVVDHRSRNLCPAFRQCLLENNDVDRQPDVVDRSAKPVPLLEAVIDSRLDYEEVDIAIRALVAAGMGTKQEHLGVDPGSLGQRPSGLIDQVARSHEHKVAEDAADNAIRWLGDWLDPPTRGLHPFMTTLIVAEIGGWLVLVAGFVQAQIL